MESTETFRRLASALPGVILVLALSFSIFDPNGSANEVRHQVFDLYQWLKPRAATPSGPHAVYIDIDRESENRLGAWPWPRTRLADLVTHAAEAGASAILLDMPLPGPDPTSPAQVLAMWTLPEDPLTEADLRDIVATMPDHDKRLATALANANTVTSFTPGKGPGIADAAAEPTAKASIALTGGNAHHYAPAFDRWTTSQPLFERAASGNGATLPDAAHLGTVRALPLLVSLKGELYPSGVLEVIRRAHHSSSYRAIAEESDTGFAIGIEPGIKKIEIQNGPAAKTAEDGSLRLYFSHEPTPASIPAWRLLTAEADLSGPPGLPELKNRIAIIGLSANGSEKLYDTPLGIRLASGAIAASAIDQIIAGTFLVRPGWASVAEQLFTLVVSTLTIFIVLRHRFLLGCAIAGTLVMVSIYFSWWVFLDRLWLIDPALSTLTIFSVFAVTALLTQLRVESETRFLENQFARRLSSPALTKIFSSPKLIQGEGAHRDVTSMVCGLRNFNIIADRYLADPDAYTSILNRFFTPATKIVLDRNGMVDRYVGDTLMAIWNVPLDETKHASRGCDAALRIVENLEELNEFLEQDARRQHLPYVPLSLSAGIDSGQAITGNVGALQRFDYGVLGEPVSFATYLQRNAHHYGPAIIVGEGTYKLVQDRYALLEIDMISTPRYPEGWRVYSLLGDPIMRANPKFRALKQAHEMIFAAYRNQRWSEARNAIAECRKLSGAIPTLYDFYEERIGYYQLHPPGDDWNGAWFAGRI